MKTNFIKTIGLIFFICSLSLNAISQIDKALVADLNKALKSSLYKTTISIDDQGVVKREDNNGNTFEYNLTDISKINYAEDGFHNILIEFKEGKKAKGIVEKRKVELSLNVISFQNKIDCDTTIEIFNKLIKKGN